LNGSPYEVWNVASFGRLDRNVDNPEINVGSKIVYGPLGMHCAHLCVDMQRLFAEKTEWHTPWMSRISPVVHQIAKRHPAETIFTRFIPAERPGEGQGTWQRYYQRWASMTLERLGADMIELVPELAALVPPASVIDKHVYSPWMDSALNSLLLDRRIETLVVTGGETDVCVFATVLGAIDRGYRIVIVTDAVCSSSDASHDASMDVYRSRYGQQVEIATAEQVLDTW
jgi:nicotinamidase-related amidase